MSTILTDEQRAIRKAVREFGENEIRPVAREYDKKGMYPHDIIQTAADYDFVGPSIPKQYGGAGMGALSSVIVTEELWRADPGIACAIGNTGFSTNTHILSEYGSEWMKEEYLAGVAAGEVIDAIAVSEAAHGSDVASIETTAELDGDEWVLNGSKMWISNGSEADITLVFAKTDTSAGHRGISVFLVPNDTDGYKTTKIENKLGVKAADLAEVSLSDVRVPKENLIGERDKGFYYFMESLDKGRVVVAAQAVGAAQAALDAAREYALEREQFDQPISEFQGIQHMLAEMGTKVEAARSLTYRAAQHVDEDSDDANCLASMAKLFATERAVEVADDAIQVHGGAGYVTDFPVERYYRDVRVTKIYEGTSEVQKNIIADEIL